MSERTSLDVTQAAQGRGFEPDPDLLKRIEQHRLDDDEAELPFSVRLAQENGWQYDYALNVIAEYRRFVYLACIASGEVTPSDEVDQVWHLHLAYSRDYWLNFCQKVLNQPLHHGPTRGGDAEEARYKANYERTLKLYRDVLGEAPPPDIWPPAAIRFAPAQNVRVNRALFAVKPKPNLVRATNYWGLLISVIVLVFFSFVLWENIQRRPDLAHVIMLGLLVALWLSILKHMMPTLQSLWHDDPDGEQRIVRTQHGFRIEYGATIGAAGGGAAVISVSISGDGMGEGGDPGGGSDGGGCGGGD